MATTTHEPAAERIIIIITIITTQQKNGMSLFQSRGGRASRWRAGLLCLACSPQRQAYW